MKKLTTHKLDFPKNDSYHIQENIMIEKKKAWKLAWGLARKRSRPGRRLEWNEPLTYGVEYDVLALREIKAAHENPEQKIARLKAIAAIENSKNRATAKAEIFINYLREGKPDRVTMICNQENIHESVKSLIMQIGIKDVHQPSLSIKLKDIEIVTWRDYMNCGYDPICLFDLQENEDTSP